MGFHFERFELHRFETLADAAKSRVANFASFGFQLTIVVIMSNGSSNDYAKVDVRKITNLWRILAVPCKFVRLA